VEAVKLAEQHVYDVILMDQRMPGMDGTEAMKEIRALENKRNENTPVICLTADAIRGAKEKYLAQGFSDYLTKPVNGEELEQVLRENIPKEKIQTKTAAEEEEKTVTTPDEPKTKEPSDPLLAALEKAGVDTEKGMMFCQNDEEIYREVLSEFSNDYETRSESIQSYHDAADWGNYMIYVHSLKSSAKTIGAHRLFELAANLEIASRDEDAALVERDHAEALQLYNEVVTAIRAHLGTSDAEEEADFLVFKPE
jgi:CheY-like chemotaxis protein